MIALRSMTGTGIASKGQRHFHSDHLGDPIVLPIRWFEKGVGGVAVGESFRDAVEQELFLPHAVGCVGQMNETGAVMGV